MANQTDTPTDDALRATAIDPAVWLEARGWKRERSPLGEVWNRVGHVPEDGWRGGWTLCGAVHRELDAQNAALLKAMGLYRPPTRRRRQ